jgi:hypothetical protein
MIPKNEDLSIIPNYIYIKIDNFFKSKLEDIECDQDETRKKYNIFCFNDIKNDFFTFIKTKSFWKNSMNLKHCDHLYKSGTKVGTYCNKLIDISYDIHKTKDNGSYKCFKHVSKSVYKSTKRDIVDENKFCIDINNRNKKCRNYKLYGNYCSSHYTRYKYYSDNIKNDIFYYLYYDINEELNILNNVDILFKSPEKNNKINNKNKFSKVISSKKDKIIFPNTENKIIYNKYIEIKKIKKINRSSSIDKHLKVYHISDSKYIKEKIKKLLKIDKKQYAYSNESTYNNDKDIIKIENYYEYKRYNII